MPDQDQAVDFIPDYVSDEVRAQLLAFTRESERTPGPWAIPEFFVRHWCETVEDGNPLYLDPQFARSKGYADRVVPPAALLSATAWGDRWPWPPRGEWRPQLLFEIKKLLDCPVGIATDMETEYLAPVQVGERLSTSERLTSISPWKKTRLGEGHFLSWVTTYWNEAGDPVARQTTSLFAYGRGGDHVSWTGGYSNAIEEAIEGERTGYEANVADGIFWEDVAEGDELPRLWMPINVTRCVFMASATRDFAPQHSNRDYAQERSKTKDMFVNTQFNMGMISRLLTDWSGPAATVRKIKLSMKGNVCVGDDMILTGTVARKYVEDGEHRIDVDVVISTQDGPTTPAAATLVLPSRAN
jgi:acyl dehydratase